MSNSIAGEAVVPGLAASPTNRINNFGYYLSVKKNKICTSTSVCYRDMNSLTTILLFLLFFNLASCKKDSYLTLSSGSKKQIIAFVPLDDFETSALDKLTLEISAVLKKPIIMLPARQIPFSFYNTDIQQYSADSILDRLPSWRNDSIIELVGLTHQPIFFVDEKLKIKMLQESLFGFGDHPGHVCIVSDYRLRTTNPVLYLNRIKKTILHEIGHNMGLDHCKNDKCIMSDQNGNLKTLDSNDFYCAKCLKQIQQTPTHKRPKVPANKRN